jgi:hypothetical protein
MSQLAVERVLGRLLTDPEFRNDFLEQPVGVCRDQGLDLTPVELAALSRIDARTLRALAVHLDPKIVRAMTRHLGDGEGRVGLSRSARDSQRGAV